MADVHDAYASPGQLQATGHDGIAPGVLVLFFLGGSLTWIVLIVMALTVVVA